MKTARSASASTRYAIVTGGGSGIGRAICERLSGLGWAVAVADIDLPAAEAAASSLASGPAEAWPCELEVADPASWDRLLRRLRDRWPRADLLVNNAGVLHGGELASAPPDAIRRLVDVNLTGTLLSCRAVAPWLIDSAERSVPADGRSPRSGIINTASIFAPLAPPGFAVYSATKAAVVALSGSVRGELGPHGLNVTVTLPGAVRTQLFERAAFATAAFGEAAHRFAARAQLEPRDVAAETLDAAHRGRGRVVIGRRARWYAWLQHALPSLTARSINRAAARQLRLGQQDEPTPPADRAAMRVGATSLANPLRPPHAAPTGHDR